MSQQILSWNNVPVIFNGLPLKYEIPLIPFMTFYTEASTNTFDPNFNITGGGILYWNLGDGSLIDSNSFSHTYSLAGNKLVKVYEGTTIGPEGIRTIDLGSDNLVGILNISSLDILYDFRVYNNLKLTEIINPNSNTVFTVYNAYNCNLTGTLDLRGLKGLGGDFNVDNNALQTILFPDTSQYIYDFRINDNNLIGILDISSLINLGGYVNLADNPNLTQVINPSTAQLIYAYHIYNCDVSGTLDLRPLKNIYGLRCNGNDKLTQILTSDSSQAWGFYWPYNCNLTGTLDVSNLINFGGDFEVYQNSNLNTILNPVSPQLFTKYWAYSCDLTGTLDVSGLSGLSGSFQVQGNSSLNTILNPDSSQSFSYYYAFNCDLTGTLDVSGLTGLGGSFQVYGNPNLTQILNPSTNKNFTAYIAYNCGLTDTMDLRPLKRLGGDIRLFGNANLTTILNPDSSAVITKYYAHDCDLTGALDVSNLTGLGEDFRVQSNPNLNTLVLPNNISHRFTYIDCASCALNTASIDNMLSKLSAYWDASIPTANATVYLQSGLNSPPTNSSSNSTIAKIHTIFDNSTAYDASIVINYGLTQLMNFDGNFYFSRSTTSASTGIDYRISFDCYADVSRGPQGTWGTYPYVIHVGGTNMGIRFIGTNVTNYGKIMYYYNGSTIRYECQMMSPREKHHVDFYYNNTTTDISLYIDNIIQTKTATSEDGAAGAVILVGGTTISSASNCKNYTLWNLDLNGDHFYEGEPSGNTEAAWSDNIGTWDLSINKYTGYAGDPSVRYAIFGQIGA